MLDKIKTFILANKVEVGMGIAIAVLLAVVFLLK